MLKKTLALLPTLLLSQVSMGQNVVTVTYQPVVETGQTYGGFVFNSFDPPAINLYNSVAFLGSYNPVSSTNYGCFCAFDQGSSYSLDAISYQGSGSPSPGPGLVTNSGAFTVFGGAGLSRPLIDDSDSVAFIGGHNQDGGQGNQMIIRRTNSGTNTLEFAPDVADADDDFNNYYFGLPSDASPLRGLANIVMPRNVSGSIVGWYAKLFNIQGDNRRRGGMFCASNLFLTNTLVRQFDPFSGGQVSDNLLDRNVFNAMTMNGSLDAAICVESTAPRVPPDEFNRFVVLAANNAIGNRTVAYEGTPAPGTAQLFKNLNIAPVINDDSNVAFRAQLDDGSWGIWAEAKTGPGFNDHTLELVAIEGPSGISGLFGGVVWTGFSDPIIAADNSKYFTASFDYNGGSHTGVFGVTPDNTTAYLIASTAGGLSNTTPKQPNHVGPGGGIGMFTGFADPFVNESGNVTFLADVDIMNTTLLNNLSGIPVNFIDSEGVFCIDHFGQLRTITVVGQTMADIIPGGAATLVITDLKFESTENQINSITTLEGRGAGYQDGRRMPLTNEITIIEPGSDCKYINFAFVTVSRDMAFPLIVSESLLVAELQVCNSGGGCSSCLCSLDPDCVYGWLLLNGGPDFDENGVVDTVDLLIINDALGLTEGRADLTLDGIVDNNDLDAILEQWGNTSPE
jgi:hypothetical protein